MKDKFPKIFAKREFYIVLFICIFALAITGVMASRGGFKKQKKEDLSQEDFMIVPEEEPALEATQMEKEDRIAEEDERKEEEDIEFVEDEEVAPKEEVEQEPTSNIEGMLPPVDGDIGFDFAQEDLIYSETLEEWTTHEGIDIFAKEGQEVKAALSGQISEVYEDELWGMVIILDHGDGLLTKYANLATIDMVQEGTRVEKGTVISRVGTTAAIEMIMEPHVHFEVIKDGKSVDPKDYIPEFSHLK